MSGIFSFLNPSVVLENVQRGVDKGTAYIQCRCPACAAEGGDSTGKNHLRIYATGAFICAKYQKEAGQPATEHNRLIRRLIRADASNDPNAADVVIIDPEPTIEVDKVYSEDMLADLVPDYSYWTGRRISETVLKKLGGGLAPSKEKSKLSGRYVFPIRNLAGQLTGFSGRLVGENSFAPKWKHLVRASRTVYPCHATLDSIKSTRRVVLVESIGDLAQLLTSGIESVLVLLGLNLNSRILSTLIATNPAHIYIATNNDKLTKTHAAGNRAADKVRHKLLSFFNEDKVVIRLPQTANDWNEATPEELATFKIEVES